MNIESRLTEVAKRWIDEEENALLAHPESAIWSRYNAGQLPPEEIERLRDHLVSCRSCRSAVFEAPKFGTAIVPEPELSLAQSDWEARQAWHALHQRTATVDPGGRIAETEPAGWIPRAPAARSWMTWASPLVAVLSLSIAGWTWYQANQPHLGVVIAEAVPAGGSRGVARGIEEGEGRPLALLLPLPELPAGTPVRVEILDGAGALVWRGESPATAEGEFGLEIPARFRRIPGCQVRVSVPAGDGGNAGSWRALGTFVVTAQAGGPGEDSAP